MKQYTLLSFFITILKIYALYQSPFPNHLVTIVQNNHLDFGGLLAGFYSMKIAFDNQSLIVQKFIKN